MIEIEKNFDLRPEDKERLIQGAELIAKKTFTDVYYDSADFSLTTKDYWLRQRDGEWELKVPLNSKGMDRGETDLYEELETEQEIVEELKISTENELSGELRKKGIVPFATITTEREYYRKSDFNLDFDIVKDLNYTTFEAELLVESPKEIPEAEKRIIDFAKER